jgi:hypothetical protein
MVGVADFLAAFQATLDAEKVDRKNRVLEKFDLLFSWLLGRRPEGRHVISLVLLMRFSRGHDAVSRDW